MKMSIAIDIFKNIESDIYTDLEKAEAIFAVMIMPTHNSVTKSNMLKVINYLWNENFEVEEKEDEQ